MKTIIKFNIQTYQITYKVESLIYQVREHSHYNGDIGSVISEHSKEMSTGRRTQECDVRTGTRARTII